MRGKRDQAILAVLLGCGLRRAEAASIRVEHLQLREEHWVIADLVGKGHHVRTVLIPEWVKKSIDEWITEAEIINGNVFRRVNRQGRI